MKSTERPPARVYTRDEIAIAQLEGLRYEIREEVAELGCDTHQQAEVIALVDMYADHLIRLLRGEVLLDERAVAA